LNIFVGKNIALTSIALGLAATTVALVGPAGLIPASATSVDITFGSQTYQTWQGLGASEAFGQASAVVNAGTAVEDQVMNDLYSKTNGAGLNILRNRIPAGEIEPNSPGSPNATPNYAALGDDEGQVPFTQMAERYGVDMVMADAWSAPGYMKTNGSVINGGTLCGVPGASCSSGDWRQAYANYLIQYLRDYAADGINVNYVDFENEANFAPGYDSMIMSGSQNVSFIDVFGPALASSGLSTQLDCCNAEGWPLEQGYVSAILSDAAANSFVKLFTSHGYAGAPNSPLPGNKPAWETEWGYLTSWDASWDDGTGGSGMTWANNIWAGLTEADLSAFFYWWGTDSNGDALLNINGSSVQTSGRLFAFGQVGRYVQQGAVRTQVSSSNPSLEVMAFANPDGSTSLVAINTSSSPQPVVAPTSATLVSAYSTDSSEHWANDGSASISGGQLIDTVPGRSMTTYVLGGSGGGTTTTPTGGGGTTTTTQPGGSGFPSGYGTLKVANDSLCLDSFGNTANAGAVIDQWACNGGSNQDFQFVPTSGGYGELQVESSGQDVTAIAEGSSSASAQGVPDIVQEPVNGSSAAQWLPEQQSDGSWQFKNQNSGLCLDVYGATSNQGQQLDQWPCKNAPGTNQDFLASATGPGSGTTTTTQPTTTTTQPTTTTTVPSGFPSGYHTLVVANDNLCLDSFGNTANAGAIIDQWACNGGSNQDFQFVPTSGGYGELQVQSSGQDVAVLNSSTAQGQTDIVQEPVSGTSAAQWLPEQQSDGSWQFQNLNSGLCLDVYGAGSNQGQQLDQWPCKNAPGTNQDFKAQ
jgi:O-glycosyl hydrolase